MENPCRACKRAECPEVCRPWVDYLRGKRKRGIRTYEAKGKKSVPGVR